MCLRDIGDHRGFLKEDLSNAESESVVASPQYMSLVEVWLLCGNPSTCVVQSSVK